ncbi:MAG: hypothetical protein Q8S00_04775 [Deltaproteobacteria bacterium]|nr:hypothetical protein [Deltaproteobacteria bacterium]
MAVPLAVKIAPPAHFKRFVGLYVAPSDFDGGDFFAGPGNSQVGGFDAIILRPADNTGYNHPVQVPVVALEHEMIADSS